MSNLTNPITLLKPEWISTIRTESANAEKTGKLTKKQLALANDQEWFKMLAPTASGGKQLSVPDVMQIEEALACADGSFGWVVTLCAGASWFGGFMNAEQAKKLFGSDKVCVAGSGAATGTADVVSGGGYVINGKWNYASGSGDATAFTANCMILKDGKKVMDGGKPKVLAFLFNKNEVIIGSDWNGMGMAATSSHSFEVRDLSVGTERVMNTSKPVVNGSLYHYPFLQLAEATLAINLCGMALHFMELCEKIIADKATAEAIPHLNVEALGETYASLNNKLQTARQKMYYAVDMSWQVCAANKEISQSVLYKVSSAAAILSKVVRDCVNTLYPYCGLAAAAKDSEINRVWRDLHTAGQHSLLVADGTY